MNAEVQGKAKAVEFREKHNLGVQPLGDLVSLIENVTDYEVTVLDVDDSDEHGLTMRDPVRDAAFIAVARTRNPMRQRSTLAHELSHVLFEDWFEGVAEELSQRTFPEQRADAFARNLLIPLKGIEGILGRPGRELTEADLSLLVQSFLVSPAIAAIALSNGGYIAETKKKEWMKISTSRLATRFGWSEQYAMLQSDSDKTRAPQRLLTRAIAGYQEGIVSAQTIAVLRNLPVEDVVHELEAAGIFPSIGEGELPAEEIGSWTPRTN